MDRENIKTVIGLLLLFVGILVLTLGEVFSGWIKLLAGILVIIGVVILFTKKHIDNDSLKGGWIPGGNRTDIDD